MNPISILNSQAAINADALTLTSATASQLTGETATPSSAIVSYSFIVGSTSDKVSLAAYLVSAPVGNTQLPTLELVETSNAVVDTSVELTSPVNLGTQFNSQSKAFITGISSLNIVRVSFKVYMNSPKVTGSYAIRIFPLAESGGIINATPATLTLSVSQDPNTPPITSPNPAPTETATFTPYSTSLIISNTSPVQYLNETSTSQSAVATISFISSGAGETISVLAALVAAPAGNTRLPNLELLETVAGSVSSAALLNESLSLGALFPAMQPAYIRSIGHPTVVTVRFKIFMNSPSIAGTYIVKVIPAVVSGSQNTNVSGVNVSISVTENPALNREVTSASSILSTPTNLQNDSDAIITARSNADIVNEVAVIRVSLRNRYNYEVLETYTALITGPGVLGQAVESSNIETTGLARVLQVDPGKLLTVYADGTWGQATIFIYALSGELVATETVVFEDYSSSSVAQIGLTFSSFPKKGSPVTLTANANVGGFVRYYANDKRISGCVKVAVTGTPKKAVCRWKPSLSGVFTITAQFTPTDVSIVPSRISKDLIIGRRTGSRL